jgi:RNA polymerase sigma factor (sigma-70 family)
LLDPQLLQRCLKDDQRAHAELYKLTYNKTIGLCWRYASGKEEAVELLNIGFVKILMNIKSYDASKPFEPWAKRIIVNSIFNEFKRNKKYKENISLVEVEDLKYVPESEWESEDQLELIETIKNNVLKLPRMTAKVFNLYAIDGYMHHEIATMLGISENTSMWHYSEARKKIKSMMGIEEPSKVK